MTFSESLWSPSHKSGGGPGPHQWAREEGARLNPSASAAQLRSRPGEWGAGSNNQAHEGRAAPAAARAAWGAEAETKMTKRQGATPHLQRVRTSVRAGGPPSVPTLVSKGDELGAELSEAALDRRANATNEAFKNVEGGVVSLDPKVMIPFQAPFGHTPRRVAIQRKKREFAAHDIDALLRERYGISGAEALMPAAMAAARAGNVASGVLNSVLAIDLFDNTDYDTHRAAEWIALGTADGAEEAALPGRGLRFPDAAGDGDNNSGGAGAAAWEPCVVRAWDPEARQFEVEWARDNARARLGRLSVCFEPEEPTAFAERVARAHESRKTAEALIRYNLYVDCMPTDEIAQLDSQQIGRIVACCLSTESLRKSEVDTSHLLNEVNTDYVRTMNKLIFDQNVSDPKHAHVFGALNLPAARPPPPIPHLGVVPTAPHDFTEAFNRFAHGTSLTQLEAVFVLMRVHEACDEIIPLRALMSKSKRSLRLEEFEKAAGTSIQSLLRRLKEKWTAKITAAIRTGFAGLGKGWYNTDEARTDVYQHSKLKRLLKRVKLMMEDSLRYLTIGSLEAFTGFIETCVEGEVVVNTTSDAETVFTDPARPDATGAERLRISRKLALTKPPPLFVVDLVLSEHLVAMNQDEVDARQAEIDAWLARRKAEADEKRRVAEEKAAEEKKKAKKRGKKGKKGKEKTLTKRELAEKKKKEDEEKRRQAEEDPRPEPIEVLMGKKFEYSTPPPECCDAVAAAFDDSLGGLAEIETVDRAVMNRLFWSTKPLLPAPSATEGWVQALRVRIVEAVKQMEAPLEAYLHTFDEHVEFINTDVDKLIAELDREFEESPTGFNAGKVFDLVDKHLQEEMDTIERLPLDPVRLGMFMVNRGSMRNLVSKKHQEIVNRLLEMVAMNCRSSYNEMNDKTSEIMTELRKHPKDIEDLTDLLEFAQTVPSAVENLQKPMQGFFDLRKRIESYSYTVPEEDWGQYWKLYGQPKAIDAKRTGALKMMAEKKVEYSEVMQGEQTVFENTLTKLEGEIRSLQNYTDMSRWEHVERHVKTVEEKLLKADENARTFNQRARQDSTAGHFLSD